MYTKQNVFLRVHDVAAVLRLQYMLHVMFFPMFNVLYIYVSTSFSVCTVLNIAVFCSFPGMRIRYFLNDSEMVPLAHIITGITVVFTFHMGCILLSRSLESFQLLS